MMTPERISPEAYSVAKQMVQAARPEQLCRLLKDIRASQPKREGVHGA